MIEAFAGLYVSFTYFKISKSIVILKPPIMRSFNKTNRLTGLSEVHALPICVRWKVVSNNNDIFSLSPSAMFTFLPERVVLGF